MIDWLKYFPYKLRMAGDEASFKGPSFTDAKDVILMPGGNTIHLLAPRHCTQYDKHQVYLKGNNDLTHGFRMSNWGATDNWLYSQFLYRSWTYWLEWFGGGAGDLSITVSVWTRQEGREFKGVSLFYPRVFEYAVSNYLSSHFGFKEPGVKFIQRAPVNWKIHSNLPVFSCSFELMNLDYPTQMFYMFPITKSHFVEIKFFYTGAQSGLRDEMRALARQIIDSVHMELSPSSLAELERVKNDIGELSLTEEFAPLKWPVEVEEIEQTSPPAPMLSRA